MTHGLRFGVSTTPSEMKPPFAVAVALAAALASGPDAVAQTTLQVVTEIARYGRAPPARRPRHLLRGPEVSGGQISPNGNYFTFTRPYNGERNGWIRKIDEPLSAARPPTAFDPPVPG